MKKIAEFKAEDGRMTKVYRDAEWEEYRVKYFNHQGVHMDASDYHTSDRDDAIKTAKIAVGANNDDDSKH